MKLLGGPLTALPRRRVQGYDPGLACQCNTECGQHGNCCPDYDQECGGGGGGGSLTDAELRELSELLVRLYGDPRWPRAQH